MAIFGPDTSKWQGDVSWAPVDKTMAFGWAKVSEGPGKGIASGYVSERWRPEKPEMAARAKASGFVPGGYLFLAQGTGSAQADFFAKAAGDMTGWAIAVDVEPRDATGSRPTLAQARACVARLRQLYPHHPIGGYIPHWYWGSQDTTFVDYLWASHYVSGGPASPQALYDRVSPAQWAGYGGRKPALLQFTDKALIDGVSGPCDCSAFRGTPAELAQLLLGGHQPEDRPMALKRVWIPSPNHSPRGGARVRLIVLHTTEGAQSYQSLGAFFANPASQVSSHVGIDDTPGTVGEYVRRSRAAWTAAGANQAGVHGEFCTPSGAADGWSRADWLGKHHQMLVNAAAWIREEAALLDIPIVALTPAQAQGSGRGVCQHSDLGAWGGGHHDCGHGFPMDYVISLARGGSPAGTEELMQPAFMVKGANAKTPVAIPNGAKRLRLFSNGAAQVHVDLVGVPQPAADDLTLGYAEGAQGCAVGNAKAAVLTRKDAGDNEVSFVLTA
jgi:hypothetical protein